MTCLTRNCLPLLLLASTGLIEPEVSFAALAEFIPLGDLDMGLYESNASSVSGDGGRVAGSGTNLGFFSDEAVYWDAPTFSITPLRSSVVDDGYDRFATSISASGEVLVGIKVPRFPPYDDAAEAFRWTEASGFEPLAGLAALESSHAFDVSADGSIVVGVSRDPLGQFTAVTWNSLGNAQSLGRLSGSVVGVPPSSYAISVSGDGESIVGASTSTQGTQAFLWTQAIGMVGLGDLPGGIFDSRAEGISADGKTVVGFGRPDDEMGTITTEAMYWTEETGIVGLGFLSPDDFSSSAEFASAEGDLIFGGSRSLDDSRWFVWRDGMGMREFSQILISDYGLESELAGWTDLRPTDISDDSLTIVGTGVNPIGDREAWYVRLDRPIGVPEPTAAAILVAALMVTTFYRTSGYTDLHISS